MPLPYRAVIFDLDGTLIREDVGFEEAVRAVACALRERGFAVSDGAYLAAARANIAEARAASGGAWPTWLTPLESIRRTLERVGAPDRLAPELEPAARQARLDCLELLPDAQATLEALQPQLPLGLVTNGDSAVQREKLRRCNLERFFGAIAISGDLGVAKPEPAIFTGALETLAVAPEESVYVGNSYPLDVEGAAAAGMATIWLDGDDVGPPPRAKTQPPARIRTLSELRALLGL